MNSGTSFVYLFAFAYRIFYPGSLISTSSNHYVNVLGATGYYLRTQLHHALWVQISDIWLCDGDFFFFSGRHLVDR